MLEYLFSLMKATQVNLDITKVLPPEGKPIHEFEADWKSPATTKGERDENYSVMGLGWIELDLNR